MRVLVECVENHHEKNLVEMIFLKISDTVEIPCTTTFPGCSILFYVATHHSQPQIQVKLGHQRSRSGIHMRNEPAVAKMLRIERSIQDLVQMEVQVAQQAWPLKSRRTLYGEVPSHWPWQSGSRKLEAEAPRSMYLSCEGPCRVAALAVLIVHKLPGMSLPAAFENREKTSPNAGDSFPLQGLENYLVSVWQDFRVATSPVPWDSLLLALEGESVKGAAPVIVHFLPILSAISNMTFFLKACSHAARYLMW